MILRYPAYLEDFRCIAADCPDSCCKDWDVAVDGQSAALYKKMEGPLGERLRNYLYEQDGEFYFAIEAGRCPFWREDGLCRIQAEQGHDMLCKTCRDFPRLTHAYGDFTEQGLAMSCPEAARQILSAPAAAWVCRQVPGGETPEYDKEDMEILLHTREVMLTILEAGSRSVPEALAAALLYAYQAQQELDAQQLGGGAEPVDLQALAAQVQSRKPPQVLLDFYKELEILTDKWRRLLEAPRGDGSWDGRLRALARYGVERYWLQAISDYDLIGRAKMVICGCILVHFLGGELVETAQLYAKEIENDEDNVEALLDGAYGSPALTDTNILGWLLL